MRYPKERKEAVLRKMMPPHNRSVPELAEEEGISEATLYIWRRQAREKGLLLPGRQDGPEGWSARDKFNAVVESAGLNEAQLSEYCRKKGIYPEQIAHWRQACEKANDWDRENNRRLKAEQKDDRKRIRGLEKELQRKEKALAEAAALIVLRKKAQAIWGDVGSIGDVYWFISFYSPLSVVWSFHATQSQNRCSWGAASYNFSRDRAAENISGQQGPG